METKLKRGGARKGAGRKALEGKKKIYPHSLPIALVEEYVSFFPERGALVTDIKALMKQKIEQAKAAL